MMNSLKAFFLISCLLFMFNTSLGQYKMDGMVLRNSNNKAIGKIDGNYIRNDNNKTFGKVDGKVIRNDNNSAVVIIDGMTLRNSNNATIGRMEDVLKAIQGTKAEPEYVALWWFFCKEN